MENLKPMIKDAFHRITWYISYTYKNTNYSHYDC